MREKAWEGVIHPPEPGRSHKPRSEGLTMVLDKGLGPNAIHDLMETACDYIDYLKFSFGTSAFYNEEIAGKKIEIASSSGVDVYPGGTFLEVAVWQDRYPHFLVRAKDLGFNAVEVSDGTMEMPLQVRGDCIKRAVDSDLRVITEVGKKSPDEKIAIQEMHRLISHDLNLGASLVIIEAREGGKGIGIFDEVGAVNQDEVDEIVSGVEDPTKLMWETPLKNQQQYMILRFGNNVNVGNIPTTDVLALEALRQGLRGDTLKRAVERG